MKRPGFFSSSSTQMPSRSIFARMFRSAEQETPIPIGQEAPWRGRRTTRTSSAKYLPPNCAPIPVLRAASSSCASSSTSRKAWPCLLPVVGSPSRAFAEASLTVFRHASAEVPPMTKAR